MTVLPKSSVKAGFVSGARPSETNFADLIDSYTQYSELLEFIGSAISQDTGVLEIVSASATAHSILPTRLGGTGEGSLASAQDAFFQGQAGLAIVNSANRFTNTNTFAATATNFISSATGSNEGPFLVLDKPNSQSDGDNLGAILIKGADSTGASSTYAKIRGAIVSTSAGNENGKLELITTVSGASAIRFNVGAGFYANSLPDPGVNKLAGSGLIYQVQTTSIATEYSFTSTFNFDDTPPLDTEGSAIADIDITPISSASRVIVSWNVQVGHTINGQLIAIALFRDDKSSALTTTFQEAGASTDSRNYVYCGSYPDLPSATSTRTYTLRIGSNSGVVHVNQLQDGSSLFDDAGPHIFLRAEEILP